MDSDSLAQFVARWKPVTLSERAAAQSHFNDLCDVLEQPHPTDIDATGENYTFERGVSKVGGGDGWADVWKRGFFGWEYKGKHKDLNAAYLQLLLYREDLENPPLLVVCDLNRFEVHTNFTNTAKNIYAFTLDDLIAGKPTSTCSKPPLEVLRAVFTDPNLLRPAATPAQVTEAAAADFSQIADSLRSRDVHPERAAHFLVRLVFCLFAQDIGLLPKKLLSRLVDSNRSKPLEFTKRLRQLFTAMSVEHGSFGEHDIAFFDGGLFSDDEAYDLTTADLKILADVAEVNWSSIEPAIFGTLFERSLDPSKRSQLGLHYTSREDILLVVEPVVMAPLRREWTLVQQEAQSLSAKLKETTGSAQTKQRKKLFELLSGFAEKISNIRVLDPACGSGNFLYVALKKLLDLEKEISVFALTNGLSGLLPRTDPTHLFGIETNIYAHELASVVVWIGYIQWQHENGFILGSHPILRPLKNIHRMDAVLAYDKEGRPFEPSWPDADVIIGNPPFIGDKKMRRDLGDKYTDDLRSVYEGRIPGGSDFVCYWFEKARAMVGGNAVGRVGLLGTQGIRGGRNRKVLERIKETGGIFWAESDRDWILEGANVHVSMVGFDGGHEKHLTLNGTPVARINADLTSSAADLTTSCRLVENKGFAFVGSQKGGRFNIPAILAEHMRLEVGNPNGRPNADVIKQWVNAKDVAQRSRGMWIIDFGTKMSEAEAAQYEAPFEYVKANVREKRLKNLTRDSANKSWWLHQRPRPEMRIALQGISRYIATPRHSKFRLFVWMKPQILPDSALVVIAREDDYTFGVLHSRVHELWARRKGTQVREAESGFRYTPNSTFETFPFPWELDANPSDKSKMAAICEASAELNKLREAWLNPADASQAQLRDRTLTALYNQNPTWLADIHSKLDQSVIEAYGWSNPTSDEEVLENLLSLNHSRPGTSEVESDESEDEEQGEDEDAGVSPD